MTRKCMNKVHRIYLIVMIALCMLSTTSCDKKEKQNGITLNTANENTIKEQEPQVDSSLKEVFEEDKVSVWVTYWDTKGLLEELKIWEPYLKQINYFAAYFKEDGSLFVPQATNETKESIDSFYEGRELSKYLTIVNDQQLEDGTSTLKNTDLLYSLFETEETMNRHVNDILQITLEGGYDGIEIDYEAIRNDLVLWDMYLTFLKSLTKVAKDNNLSVRVLLEPSTPVDDIQFPKGIEYIMMCYNLHGYGSEPGPKANRDFLVELTEKMKKVSNCRGFALATGGFDFSSDGKTTAVTLAEAIELQTNEEKDSYRDEESKCMVFTYTKQNITHEVWFADEDTLMYWTKVLKEEGEKNISIWRLGGTIRN